jgi:recombination protein RecT
MEEGETMTTRALEVQQQKVASVRQMLERNQGAIMAALPNHMNADRFLRIALTQFQKTPKLLDCTPESFLGAVIQAAQLGLEPDGVTGMAHLIPYGGKVNFQPGFQGLMELARRSGDISQIVPRVVYGGDDFDYSYGLDKDNLRHVPSESNDPGPITHVYCIVRLKDGSSRFEVWPAARIEAHAQRYSQAYKQKKKDSPWITHFPQMAMKTLVVAALKYAPKSIELQKAIGLEEMAQSQVDQNLPIPLAAGVIDFPQEAAAAKTQLDKIADSKTDRESAERKHQEAKKKEEATKKALAEAETARQDTRKGLIGDDQIKDVQKAALAIGMTSERLFEVLGVEGFDVQSFDSITAKDFPKIIKYLKGLKP